MRKLDASFFFLLIMLLSITLTTSAQRLCETLVEDALDETDTNCDLTQPNNACYGFDTLDSYFFNEGDYQFRSPADLIRMGELHTVYSQPLDIESDEWGVGYFEMKATLHSETDETVNVMMLGDVAMENAVEPEDITEFEIFSVITGAEIVPQRGYSADSASFETAIPALTSLNADALSPDEQWVRVAFNGETAWMPVTALETAPVIEELVVLGTGDARSAMQEIFFTTGGISDCADAPNTVVIQGPKDTDFELTINGVPMQASSTVVVGIENAFDEYQRMWVTVIEGQLIVYPGTGDALVIPEGYFSTVRLTNNAGNNPGQDQLINSISVPVIDRVTGEVILGPFGRPFYRHIPIEPFALPEPITFGGFDYRGWRFYRFMEWMEGLLNYAIVIPEPEIVEPDCVPDTVNYGTPYIIQSGDTLFNLAEQYGAFVNDLVSANCIDNPALIFPGDVVYLPATPEPDPPSEPIIIVAQTPAEETPDVVAPSSQPGAPSAIGVVGTPPTNAVANTSFGTLQVQILDGLGIPVPNVPVTFDIPTGITSLPDRPIYARAPYSRGGQSWYGLSMPLVAQSILPLMRHALPSFIPNMTCGFGGTYGGYFTGCQTNIVVNTNASGIATSPILNAETQAGSFGVSATGGGFTQNFNFTVDPDVPSLMSPSGFLSSPVNQEFKVPQTYTVTVTDQYGNIIKTGSPQVQFSATGNVEFSTDGGASWVPSPVQVTADANGVATVQARANGLGTPAVSACYFDGSLCSGTILNTNLTNVLAPSCSYTATTNAELAEAIADTRYCEATIITVSGALTMNRSKVYGDVTFSGGTITSTNTNGSSSSALIDGINTACITINGTTLTGENGTHVVWTSASTFPAPNTFVNTTVNSAKDCGSLTLGAGTNVTGNSANFILLRGYTIAINGTAGSKVTVSNNPNTPTAIYGGQLDVNHLIAANNGTGDHVQVWDDSGFYNSTFSSLARAGDAGIYILPVVSDYTPTAPIDITVSNNDFDSMGTGLAALCNGFTTNIGFFGNNFIDDMNWGLYLHTTAGTDFCNVTGIAFQVQFGNTTANDGNCFQSGNVTADVAAPC